MFIKKIEFVFPSINSVVVLECVLRIKTIQFESKDETLRHIAALVLLIAFMELYVLAIRIAPNTPYLVYINM